MAYFALVWDRNRNIYKSYNVNFIDYYFIYTSSCKLVLGRIRNWIWMPISSFYSVKLLQYKRKKNKSENENEYNCIECVTYGSGDFMERIHVMHKGILILRPTAILFFFKLKLEWMFCSRGRKIIMLELSLLANFLLF